MKIIFLCGSFEPGKDGVGDYTRRLAGELVRQGHAVALLALNDPHIKKAKEEDQSDNTTWVPVLRIPALWKARDRFEYAKKWLDSFKPDWISLQYVPFAFHSKGLDFKLARNLYYLGKGYKWEVMFHELWVGMEKNARIKMKIWGKVQQMLIVKLLKTLKPLVIHTQIELYRNQLAELGFKASILPLFSNIQFNDIGDVGKNAKELIFLIFGSIHKASLIEELATEVAEFSKQRNLTPKLVMIGRCGEEQNIWKEIWSANGIKVDILGEQTTGMVSQVMQVASIGIATTPSYLIGKSGAVAAMLEHNLPVINLSREWCPDIETALNMPEGVISYLKGNLEQIFSFNLSDKNTNRLQTVSKLFIKSISL